MITIRTRIFAVVSLIVLFVLGVSILLVVLSKRRGAETPPAETINGGSGAITQDNFASEAANLSGTPSAQQFSGGTTVLPQSQAEAEKNAIRQLAKIFLERYGSYSTDSNYQNIRDVANLVTSEFWRILVVNIPVDSNPNPNSQFVGVTTVVMSAKLTKLSDISAEVMLDTVQTTDKGGSESSDQKQAVVTLNKLGGDWLVSKLEWE